MKKWRGRDQLVRWEDVSDEVNAALPADTWDNVPSDCSHYVVAFIDCRTESLSGGYLTYLDGIPKRLLNPRPGVRESSLCKT